MKTFRSLILASVGLLIGAAGAIAADVPALCAGRATLWMSGGAGALDRATAVVLLLTLLTAFAIVRLTERKRRERIPRVHRSRDAAGGTVALVTAALAFGMPREASAEDAGRIGMYDSRAIAVAYVGSPAHERRLAAAAAERRKAREAGDVATVLRIEAEGEAQQKLLHRQVFGTERVDDILAAISAEVAAVQKTHGVGTLVSKWDEAALAAQNGRESVDVTAALIDALHPTERQRQRALEIQVRAPAKN